MIPTCTGWLVVSGAQFRLSPRSPPHFVDCHHSVHLSVDQGVPLIASVGCGMPTSSLVIRAHLWTLKTGNPITSWLVGKPHDEPGDPLRCHGSTSFVPTPPRRPMPSVNRRGPLKFCSTKSAMVKVISSLIRSGERVFTKFPVVWGDYGSRLVSVIRTTEKEKEKSAM